jgi:hypothetical protein
MRHQYTVPHGPHHTPDGLINVAFASNQHWKPLCAEVLDRPELVPAQPFSNLQLPAPKTAPNSTVFLVPPARGSRIAPADFNNGATPSRTKRRTARYDSTGTPNLPAACRCGLGSQLAASDHDLTGLTYDAEERLDFVAVPLPEARSAQRPLKPFGHNCVCGEAQTDLAHAASNGTERGAGSLVCSPKKIATDRLSLSLRQYI